MMFHHLSDLLVFAAIARAGSITRAGKELGVPKSTLSRRMATLEDKLGIRLLLKSSRKLTLTEEGEAFLERCQRLSEEVNDALAFAGDLADEPRGTLRMTMPPDVDEPLLGEAIASFAARYPGISLELDESQRYVDLTSERFDVALRAGVLPDSSLVARRLTSTRGRIYASPSYLARTPAPKVPADLERHRFVILQGRRRFDRLDLRSGKRSVEVSLAGRIIATTSGMQLRLGLAGAGAIVYSGSMAEAAVRDGRLVRLLPDWTTEPGLIWLVTPSRRLLPRKTVLFIEHLSAAFSPS